MFADEGNSLAPCQDPICNCSPACALADFAERKLKIVAMLNSLQSLIINQISLNDRSPDKSWPEQYKLQSKADMSYGLGLKARFGFRHFLCSRLATCQAMLRRPSGTRAAVAAGSKPTFHERIYCSLNGTAVFYPTSPQLTWFDFRRRWAGCMLFSSFSFAFQPVAQEASDATLLPPAKSTARFGIFLTISKRAIV